MFLDVSPFCLNRQHLLTSNRRSLAPTISHQTENNMEASVETAGGETRKKTKRLWTDEEIELLITCFQERKCLWDFTVNEYSNRDQKQLAFESIDQAMTVREHVQLLQMAPFASSSQPRSVRPFFRFSCSVITFAGPVTTKMMSACTQVNLEPKRSC